MNEKVIISALLHDVGKLIQRAKKQDDKKVIKAKINSKTKTNQKEKVEHILISDTTLYKTIQLTAIY